VKVAILCAGLDHVHRGYESSSLHLFHGLRAERELDVTLIKGSGSPSPRVRRARCLRRDRRLARLLTQIVGWRRDSPQPRMNDPIVHQEQTLSELIGRAARLKLEARPNDFEEFTFAMWACATTTVRASEVLVVSEIGVAQVMTALRNRFRLNYRVLFANGGSPPGPPPYPFADLVQQLTGPAYDIAREAGEPDERQVLLPRAFSFAPAGPPVDAGERAELRRRLGLPQHRPVVLSVGAINFRTKRHDHLLREVASMGPNRPFVQLLGYGENVREARALAVDLLGAEGFGIASVRPEAVDDYYRAADIFALASYDEGFGRVYVEAAGWGLPLLVHDSPATRWVLEDLAVYVDMSKPGELRAALERMLLVVCADQASRERRQRRVRARFEWNALRPDYLRVLHRCAGLSPRRE